MDCLQDWPEPVVRVQLLSASGAASIPDRYVKPPSERPGPNTPRPTRDVNIPLIDMGGLGGPREEETKRQILDACEEWGFFQVVNHGVPPALLREVRHVWREFFHLPMELKQEYANTPKTYEGYGSRLGVEKGAILDWGDYFFLHILPQSLKKPNKWPSLPPTCREAVEEYGKQLVRLGSTLLRIFSTNLGLDEGHLQRAFGGDDIGACLRANFYPKCPQPDLTLGLSAHSDPGGLTLLLPDDRVTGLQVRQGDSWITVQPVQDSFIINIADQIQVLSNAKYRSVEHRVIVNSDAERLSLAFFYNPKADLLIAPAPELLSPERPALYPPMTYNEYRLYIRKRGPRGKSQVESLKTATTWPATDTT